jgi:hypothetical protein
MKMKNIFIFLFVVVSAHTVLSHDTTFDDDGLNFQTLENETMKNETFKNETETETQDFDVAILEPIE